MWLVQLRNCSNSGDDEGSVSEEDKLGVDDGEGGSGSESNEGNSMEVDDDDQKPERPQLPPPETGTTLFVRNVPFEATEDELRTL